MRHKSSVLTRLAVAVVAGVLSACSPATSSAPTAAPATAPPAATTSSAASASSPPAAASAGSPAAAASAVVAPSSQPATTASPVPSGPAQTIRIGLGSASPSNAGVYVADGLGFFEEQGLKMDYVDFASASQVIPALSRGDLDIGDTGINPAMFNAMARNLGLKLVADKGSQPPGFGFTALIVSPTVADQVKGPADLKGRKIAMTPPGLGTANGYVLAKYLASAQLTPNDVDIVPIAFPEQVAALTNHSVDVAIMAEPYATRATQEKIGVRLEGLDQMDPYQQVAGLVYTDKFVNEHHDLAVKWMTAYVKGIRAYDEAFTKGIGKDRIVQVLADKTDIKDKALWNEIVPAGLNPNGTLNTDSIKSAGEFFHSIGLVETVPPIDSYVDNSFTQAADQILGPAPNP